MILLSPQKQIRGLARRRDDNGNEGFRAQKCRAVPVMTSILRRPRRYNVFREGLRRRAAPRAGWDQISSSCRARRTASPRWVAASLR